MKLRPADFDLLTRDNLTSQSVGRDKGEGAASWFPVEFDGHVYRPSEKGRWKTNELGMSRLVKARRLAGAGNTLRYVRFFDDFPAFPISDFWSDTTLAGFAADKKYIVETATKVIERCLLMTTDPGDLVLDPTCGSGTTAYVAEQWGRRWITIDTSRVALALARARIMGARYPYYLLADSPEGQLKEAEVTRSVPSSQPTRGDIRQGFVYERVPHITLKSIANNAEIDVIWDEWQQKLEPLREALERRAENRLAGMGDPARGRNEVAAQGQGAARRLVEAASRGSATIDASIAAKAEFEYLYDKPYDDKKRVRVAGPFTVDSLSPHRTLAMDIDDGLIDGVREPPRRVRGQGRLRRRDARQPEERRRAAGAQGRPHQLHQHRRLAGRVRVCRRRATWKASKERRAAIFIGPEFGTVSRPDLVAAAREAADAGFDVLIACAFNYEAHAAEFEKLGRVPVLKARMNPDLHMAGELKNTGAGNLFVVFGEPDIRIEAQAGRAGACAREGRGRVPAADRRDRIRRHRQHRAVDDRHRLQRRKLLRAPGLLPGRGRPVQGAEDDAQGRDRRRGLGHVEQRRVTAVREAEDRAHRGEGDQSPGRRGDEGVRCELSRRVALAVHRRGPKKNRGRF